MGILSDLANSCEYLTTETFCSAVLENDKAKVNRQLRCQNEEKMSCCYLCQSRNQCQINCKYLGNTGKELQSVESKQAPTQNTKNIADTEANPTKEATMICSSCNVEMSQTKTQFRINGLKGPNSKLSEDGSGKEEVLPVLVYLCSHCGKIEFRVEEGNRARSIAWFTEEYEAENSKSNM
jgi:hypothetical protein